MTGGIASGKSLAASFFRCESIPVVDADRLAHQVMAPGGKVSGLLKRIFGSNICSDSGEIDRSKLRKIVLSDNSAMKKLNAITHPFIIRAMEEQIEYYEKERNDLIMCETPLLFETGLQDKFDKIIVVFSYEGDQLMRLTQKRGLSMTEARKMLRTQMPLKEKVDRADYVIYNTKSKKDLLQQCRKISCELKSCK